MNIIVGLGNPTTKYEGTRHNAGFCVIDALSEKYDIPVNQRKCRAYIGTGMIEGRRVLLAKPQTFMNLSGESVRELAAYYQIDVPSDLIVIYDDIDLETGQIRIRLKGSAGSHNGMRNILQNLGTDDFPRVRLGTGPRPAGTDLVGYVLGHFSEGEQDLMQEAYTRAVHAVELLVAGDGAAAMNEYNRKVKPKQEDLPPET